MKKTLKKIIALFLIAVMASVCVFSVSASVDNAGTEIGPAPDTAGATINYLTQDNFPNTEGYTDYPILKNDNVKWYYYASPADKTAGTLTDYTYNYNAVAYLSHAAMMPGSCNSAFQVFMWNGTMRNPWYYEGILVSMSDYGIIEITFHGTAINLIRSYLSNPTEAAGIKASVQVDDGEWQEIDAAVFTPASNDIAGRAVYKRWFQIDNLEDGYHTIRIKNDGTSRLGIDAYEIKETVPSDNNNDNPGTSDTITGMVTVALVLGVSSVVAIKKRRA